MELNDYLAILWRRKWIIAITAVVTLIVVAVGSFIMPPVYQASTTLRIGTAYGGSANDMRIELSYTDRLMNTYAKIVTSDALLGELTRRLGIDKPPKISAEVVANTELMRIIVEDQNAVLAEKAANTLAEIFMNYVAGLDIGKGTAPVRAMAEQRASSITVLEPASTPVEPSSPRKGLNIALGFLVGMVGGLGLAFLIENLDTTLYTKEQIERVTERAVLGGITHAKQELHGVLFDSTSPQAEAFRRLRINLSTLNRNNPLHTLLVTSAEPGEGKTTIAANLANAMAQSKHKILLVDCELRLPTLHKIYDLPNEQGLSDVLMQKTSLAKAAQGTQIPGLWILSSGTLPPNPSELVNSPEMTALIKQAAEQFDIVLLDTPALLAVKHSAALASTVDGVLLVVRRTHTRQSAVRTACELLVNARARSIGVVVNHAEIDDTLSLQQALANKGESKTL